MFTTYINLLATDIRRTNGTSRSESFKQAYSLYAEMGKLNNLFKAEGDEVAFYFRKIDGTIRFAVMSKPKMAEYKRVTDNNLSDKVVRYYDLLADGWRSFRKENYIGLAIR